ncbi:MAG: 4a-hydroxytetrahydrobiopterin dehydratase, partial [Thermoanaerobaculia bacterium]
RIALREVDIDRDPALRAQFTNDVPVIFIDGTEAFRHRVDPSELAAFLRRRAGVPPPAVANNARSHLADEKCVPCRGGVPPVKGSDLAALQRDLGGGWNVVQEHHLEKEFTFPNFADALAFTNRIGEIAEEQGHHPDIYLAWGKVRVTIWTHKIDGLTRSDFVLAAKIDGL